MWVNFDTSQPYRCCLGEAVRPTMNTNGGKSEKKGVYVSDYSKHMSKERRKGETRISPDLPLQQFPVPLEALMGQDSPGGKMG